MKEDSAFPDARCRERKTFCGPKGLMTLVYCVNCGADGGAVTEEWAKQIFYLCDDCYRAFGSWPVPIPDELVRGE